VRIFISSPFRGDIETNKRLAEEYAAAVWKLGHSPFLPHGSFDFLYYCVRPGEVHKEAMKLCFEMIDCCDELWQFGPETEGMAEEREFADDIGVPVRDGLEMIKGEK